MERPNTQYADSYWRLLARLESEWSLHRQQSTVILITSPGPGVGKTTTAVNLAVILAMTNRKVLLVDGDLHRPELHRWFNLHNSVGLTDILGKKSLKLVDAIQGTDVPGLSVLCRGSGPAKPGMVSSKGTAERLVKNLKKQSDVVVIDTSPVLAKSDMLAMCLRADRILVVADTDRTRMSSLVAAIQLLKDTSGQAGEPGRVEAVLNRFKPLRVVYYLYKHYYDEYYYYAGGAYLEPQGDGNINNRQRAFMYWFHTFRRKRWVFRKKRVKKD